MYERVLVPLDGSPAAETILVPIRELLRRSSAEAVLFQAVGYPVDSNRDPVELERAFDYLEGIRKGLGEAGSRARIHVTVGTPAETILETAATEKADFIAMTTHGRTGLQRWIFGSVAEKVLRASRTPILLIRPSRSGAPTAPRFGTILVPSDGSDLSMAVAPHVVRWARIFGSRVVLAHVFEKERPTHELKAPTLPLKGAVETFQRADVRAEEEFRTGDPAGQILGLADDLPADLIAMSTHGRSGVSRWVLGSVAEKVIRTATAPVLVVRAAE